jgi:pyruvate dehydrogenase E1 component alpha subunit
MTAGIAPLVRDDAYRLMYLIRAFELRVRDLVAGTPIARFTHLSAGQEAVAVGVCATLLGRDRLALTYRNHAVHLARGADPGRLMAEVLGRTAGYCGGRAGSMHAVAPELGVIDASAIVSGNIPIGTGSALTSWIRSDGVVTACFFGDGAVGEGAFHESLNMAALWRLPIVYVCENNGYAMSTPFSATSPVATVAERASAYALPAQTIDGDDVFAVHEAAARAVSAARTGGGPTLLECRTSLLEGHFVGLRPAGAGGQGADPLHRLRAEIGDTRATRIEAAVDVSVADAARFAERSRPPTNASLICGDFADVGA